MPGVEELEAASLARTARCVSISKDAMAGMIATVVKGHGSACCARYLDNHRVKTGLEGDSRRQVRCVWTA
jgi:hypothetical protein